MTLAKHFIAEQSRQQIIDDLYFSYTTITTAGYRDVTASSQLGRIPEALVDELASCTFPKSRYVLLNAERVVYSDVKGGSM